MTEFAGRLVRVLSGGQKRRLALAMELASKPAMLLCDEVTAVSIHSPRMRLSRFFMACRGQMGGRLFPSLTVRHLGFYDSVLVLYQGIGAYQGPGVLTHYFRCEDPQDLYSQLVRTTRRMGAILEKHRRPFEEAMSGTGARSS
jgi:ABC-type microcin C transport system duplicated ATPase subunit YejF